MCPCISSQIEYNNFVLYVRLANCEDDGIDREYSCAQTREKYTLQSRDFII